MVKAGKASSVVGGASRSGRAVEGEGIGIGVLGVRGVAGREEWGERNSDWPLFGSPGEGRGGAM